jgi:hypothetical protein
MNDRKARLDRFFDAARALARSRNSDDRQISGMTRIGCYIDQKAGNLATYGDDFVQIAAEIDGPALSIYLVRERNPAVSVYSDGRIIRTHGQMWGVEKHVLDLANPLRLLAEQSE